MILRHRNLLPYRSHQRTPTGTNLGKEKSMGTDHPGWADNVERMFRDVLRFFDRLINKNRLLFWVIALGGAVTLGVFDVPVFEAVVDGLVKLAGIIPGLGFGG